MAAAVDRNVKLSDFDDTSMSILEWVQHVDMAQTAAGWTDAQTCSRAKMFLKGKAMVWLQNRIVAQTEGLNRWYPAANEAGIRQPNLRTLLMDRFLLVNTPSEQARLRATLSQKDGEDSATFYDRVEQVQFALDQALPVAFRVDQKAAYDIVHEGQVLQAFINGLKLDVRTHVTTLNLATASEARNAAMSFEMANSRKPKIASLSSNPDHESMASQVASMVINAFGYQNRGRGRGNYRGRGNGRGAYNANTPQNPDGCEYCGFLGHTKPECHSKKRDITNGIHAERSENYAPGRIGRGRGRGRANSRGFGPSRGQTHEIRPAQGPGTERPSPPVIGYPPQHNQMQPPQYIPQTNPQPQQLYQDAGSMQPFRFYSEN